MLVLAESSSHTPVKLRKFSHQFINNRALRKFAISLTFLVISLGRGANHQTFLLICYGICPFSIYLIVGIQDGQKCHFSHNYRVSVLHIPEFVEKVADYDVILSTSDFAII